MDKKIIVNKHKVDEFGNIYENDKIIIPFDYYKPLDNERKQTAPIDNKPLDNNNVIPNNQQIIDKPNN